MFCETTDETMLHCGDGFEMKRHERLLLRPWLENLIDSAKIPGLEWIDNTRTLFRVPWKHQSRKTWSLGHSSVFLEWAKNTGRWKVGDPEPHYAQLKTRLRCAFSKAPDIEEMKDMHCSKAEEPYKVYRFIPKKENRFYPFGRKAIARKSIHSSLRRNNMLPGCHSSLGNTLKKFDGKPMNYRNKIKAFDEIPLVTCNDLAADDIAAPIQSNEISRQVERVDDFQGYVVENSLAVNNLPTSTAYPVIHAVFDSLTIPKITTTDFKVAAEEEAQEYYCGKRQTILPPVDGSLSRPESKSSGMYQPGSMSVMISQSPHCSEFLPVKESGSDLDLSDLSDLPKMSILEKVETWKMTGFTAGNNENGNLKTPIVDDWMKKVTERTTDENATTETVCKTNADDVQSFRQMVIGDNNSGIQGTYSTRDKKISLGKSGDISGSNVAVATPIFPLKNRYNISRNHPDKEMPQSPNDRSFFPHNNAASIAPSFVTVQNGKRVPLENAKCGEQHMFPGVASLDWQSAVVEKRRKLDQDMGAVQYSTFPEDPNKCGRNWGLSVDACGGNWQKHGEAYEEAWLQNGERQNENCHVQSKEEDVVWQAASFPQQNRNWQLEGSNENWQVANDRYEAKYDLTCDAQRQKGLMANKFPDQNIKSFEGQNDGSWDLYERSTNGIQQASLNGNDRSRKWSLEDASEVDVRWNILCENLAKDGPLDLSNKADFYVHYSIGNHGGLCQPEICAKMANHAPDFSRMAVNPGQNSCRMGHSKGWGNISEEQERPVKKLNHHALSMDSSLNHLKAAYKKLVLRTMYVTEKERELDSLEKRLHAREEAVHLKEQQLQKVLWALADSRLPAEPIARQSSCTKVLPEVGKSDWNADEKQRKIYEEHSMIPRWSGERAESGNQSPNETLPMENMSSTKSYVFSGDQNQIHDRRGYRSDLGDGICGSTRIVESPLGMSNLNQPFYEPIPPHVLPSVDEHHYSQNEYVRRRYLDETEVGQPSGVYPQAADCSFGSNSAVASHALSWGGKVKDDAEERGMAPGRTGVAFGRPVPKDLKLGSISMNSCPVITIGEPSAAAKTFGGRCFERRTFESQDQSGILMLRSSSFSAQSSDEVTRILPPVSPDTGVMN